MTSDPLFAHQQRALDFLADKPAAAVFSGLGTGKSRIVIEDAKRRDAALLVICPKSAIPVWQGQLERWGFDGAYCILNYEQIWRGMVPKNIGNFANDYVVMMVLDESHRIKSRTTKQSKAARKFGSLAQYRRVLTGTPVVNGQQDLWAQMDFLSPSILGKWSEFASEHLVFNPLFPGKVDTVKNIATLQSKVAPYVFSVKADDVLDLPLETDLYRDFLLPPAAARIYSQVEQELYAELDEGEIYAPNALVKILRLAQITGGFAKADSGEVFGLHDEKLRLFSEVVDELGSEPFVVFCRFIAEAHALSELLAERGVRTAELTGQTPLHERARILEVFGGPRLQGLVAQIQAGSASIDLTPARYAIYYSVGWSFGDYEQSRGRIRRHGQTRPQFYIHLQARGTIDEVIYTALARKEGVHEAVQSWWRRRA